MKASKRLLCTILVLAMLLMSLFAITSCGKNKASESDPPLTEDPGTTTTHTHSYTATTVKPTCTEKGYTKHTCSCGDTYNDTEVSAAGHSYGKTIVESYPTFDENGQKSRVCSVCSTKTTETIDALSLSLPQVSDMLKTALGGLKMTLNAEEKSTLIWSKEYDDYDASTGKKAFFVFELAEVEVDMKGDDAKGHLKLSFGIATVDIDGTVKADEITLPAAYDDAGSLYVYLNGDEVSFEIDLFDETSEEDTFSLNEEFYGAIADMFGIDKEEFAAVMYVYSSLEEFTPLIEGAIKAIADKDMPEITDEYIDTLTTIINAFGEDVITNSVTADGTLYTVNLEALEHFITLVDGKTFAEIINEIYGAGSADQLKDFIIGIPDMKLSQIADAAIRIAENSGIEVEDIYYIINFCAYQFADAEDFDFEAELNERYNLTLIELLGNGKSAEDIQNARKDLENTVDYLLGISIDELINVIYGLDSDFSSINYLKESIKSLGDFAEITILFNESDNYVEFNAEFADARIAVYCENNTVKFDIYENDEMLISLLISVEGEDYFEFDITTGDFMTDVLPDINVLYEKVDGRYELSFVIDDVKVLYCYEDGDNFKKLGFYVYEDGRLLTNAYAKFEETDDGAIISADMISNGIDIFDFKFIAESDTFFEIETTVRDEDSNVLADISVTYQELDDRCELIYIIDDIKIIYYYEYSETYEELGFKAYEKTKLMTSYYVRVDVAKSGEEITSATVTADLAVEGSDLLDYKTVIENDTITELEIVTRTEVYSPDRYTHYLAKSFELIYEYADSKGKIDITTWDEGEIIREISLTFEESDDAIEFTTFIDGEKVLIRYEYDENTQKLDCTLFKNDTPSDFFVVEIDTEDGFKIYSKLAEVVIADAYFYIIEGGDSITLVYDINKILIDSGEEAYPGDIYDRIFTFWEYISGKGKITLTVN